MNVYKLTATLNKSKNQKTIYAKDAAVAMAQAIIFIMDTANKHQHSAWAVGHIKLKDSEGNVIVEMAASS